MNKLPITASLVLASLVYACSASAASPASSANTPQQSSAAPAPANPSATKKKKSSKNHHSSKREPTQKAPTPQRISEIQSALAHGGYYQGAPNGKWDSNTVAAMQKFQSDNGLSSNGKIDASTLQKLGLGSGTAGVDAPKPVTPAPPAAAANSAATTSPPTATTTTASAVTPNPNSSAPTPKLQH